MRQNYSKYKYSMRSKKKKSKLLILIISFFLAVILIGALLFFDLPNKFYHFLKGSFKEKSIINMWNEGLYNDLILKCKEILLKDAMNTEALIFYGFANFSKGYMEKASEEKIPYIDQCIISLRRAKLISGIPYAAEIDYILGKAYFYKGEFYYDLSIKYLLKSHENGYISTDTYEYLALAYGYLGDVEKEIEFFKKANDRKTTAHYLLAIGKGYIKLEDYDEAEQYFLRALNKTELLLPEIECHFNLGKIYLLKNNFIKAESHFTKVLELDYDDFTNAEAHFQLGELYLAMNKNIEARAEWRKALQYNPNHYGALLRYYK